MKRPLRWLLLLVGVLTVTLLVMTALGLAIPRDHASRASVTVPRPPAAVLTLITDVENHPRWRPEVARVERLPTAEGQPAWREWTSHGALSEWRTVDLVPPHRWVWARVGGDARVEVTVSRDGNGSAITITHHLEEPNPLLRFVGVIMGGHSAALEQQLRSLARHVGTTPPEGQPAP